jgi:competence protein ComEC
MLPKPAWLAIGVVVSAGAAQAGPVVGMAGLPSAVAATGAVVVAAIACEAGGRPRWAALLATASLGAALVVARLALGVVLGSGAETGPAALPIGTGTWQATVASAHVVKGQQLATIRIEQPALLCAAQFPVNPRLGAGDTITWTGRFRPLTGGEYDLWLASEGIAASCQATEMTLLRHDDSPFGLLESFRQSSGDALQRVLPEPEGGLAAAILIGLRDRVDRDVAAAFTAAGVSHIVAISGWNIAIVAACIGAALGGRVGRRRRAVVTLAAIVAYTLFAGASPSVIRAAVMAAVALLTVESGRGSRVIVGLAWAVAAMIVVEPGTVGDVGFQLSAAATAGLVVWGTPLSRRLETSCSWLPGVIRESLGVSLAAQAATLPIALITFGRLALIAPAANLVAVPLVPPAMAAGAVAFMAGWLAILGAPAWLAGLVALPTWALLHLLIGVVQVAASVPGANETLPMPANVLAAGIAAVLLWRMHVMLTLPAGGERAGAKAGAKAGAATAASGVAKRGPRRRHRRLLVAAAFTVALAGSVVAARPDGSVHVIVLDVGQGDAILLEGDLGGRILVDGGPDGGALLKALDRYVPAWDRSLDAVVLTHPHDDHVAGLVALLDKYRVGRAFESGWTVSTPNFRAWQTALEAHGLRAERLRTGGELRLDDATLRVLWPDDGTVRPPELDPQATDNRKTNDSSIVLLGEYGGRRFLLTGDAEDDVDPVLLARGLPHVDMLKVAHHGSATATSAEFLAATRPSVAVISVGAANTYGHPAPSTQARLRAAARAVLRTDRSGSVDVELDAAAVTVTPEHADSGAPDSPVIGAAEFGDPALPAPPRLLYDPFDVRTQPLRIRGPAAVARTAGLAPAPLSRSRRDGGLAGVASGPRRPNGGSVARRSSRAPPRCGQAPVCGNGSRGPPPRPGLRPVACLARLPGVGPRDRRPPRDQSGG